MRFIPKTSPPDVLTQFIAAQEAAGIPPAYADFREKAELNEYLRAEQGHICCYCQQRINRYPHDCHNEHLQPQHAFPLLELDYNNLFASCSYSKGTPPGSQYCGEAKGPREIPRLIQDPNCHHFFAYNVLGEILPAGGPHQRFSDFQLFRSSLLPAAQDALLAIEVLNLNATYLVEERKKTLNLVLKFVSSNKIRVKSLIPVLNTSPRLRSFIDMILFFLNKVP
jgi:uncharacterized protein (TIGR02646 family)